MILDDGRTVTISSSRRHGDRFLVTFEGVTDRDGAASLSGPLHVDKIYIRALGDGEYWPADLIGLPVSDLAGMDLGTVTEIRPGAAQDLLVLETPSGPALVPMVSEIVVEIRPGTGITLDPPSGLLD